MADTQDKYPSPHWTVIRQRASLAGVVSDAATGAPVAGAVVEISSGPGGGKQTSRADGSYVFSGLPAGRYGLRATIPALGSRYGAAAADAVEVTDTRDAPGRLAVATQNLTLPPTRAHGTIQGKQSDGTAAPIAGATVRLRGRPESSLTDDQGRYALNAVEAGGQTIEVSAARFQPVSATVSLEIGKDFSFDSTLDPDVPPKKPNGG